jgi:hypothetical protein
LTPEQLNNWPPAATAAASGSSIPVAAHGAEQDVTPLSSSTTQTTNCFAADILCYSSPSFSTLPLSLSYCSRYFLLQPQVNVAKAAAAAFTAVALMAAPVFAAEDVKTVVCASNPTAKVCLKNSYQK